MVEVSKAEAEIIRERYPHVYIVRTMRQKSKRHHYYCEEARKAMMLLAELRGEEYNEKGGYRDRY